MLVFELSWYPLADSTDHRWTRFQLQIRLSGTKLWLMVGMITKNIAFNRDWNKLLRHFNFRDKTATKHNHAYLSFSKNISKFPPSKFKPHSLKFKHSPPNSVKSKFSHEPLDDISFFPMINNVFNTGNKIPYDR